MLSYGSADVVTDGQIAAGFTCRPSLGSDVYLMWCGMSEGSVVIPLVFCMV